jgi:hypothetical protein
MTKLTFIIFIGILASCSNHQEAADNGEKKGRDGEREKKELLDITVEKLTQQDSYPGVESNLIRSTNYHASFSGTLNGEIAFVNFLVDSIRLPIGSLRIDGDAVKKEAYSMQGTYDKVELFSGRNIYSEIPTGGPTHPVAKYELSGLNLDQGVVMVEYTCYGQTYQHLLGTATKLESLYHP